MIYRYWIYRIELNINGPRKTSQDIIRVPNLNPSEMGNTAKLNLVG